MRKIFITQYLLVILLLIPVTTQAKEIYTGIYGMVGMYSDDNFIDLVKDSGFEIIQTTSEKAVLDKAQKKGLKCLVSFWLTKQITDDDKKWQAWLLDVKNRVNMLKDHPAVFAWYLVDEPDGQQIPIDKIKDLRSIVKAIDKEHPQFTVLNTPNKWKSYLPYFDIVSTDPYPLVTDKRPATDIVKTSLEQLVKDINALKLRKQLWVVLSAFEFIPKSKTNKNIWRRSTPEEFKQMVNVSLKEGVDGILVYTLAGAFNSPVYYEWNLPVNDPLLWDAVRQLPTVVRP